jgi:hypothetical protein
MIFGFVVLPDKRTAGIGAAKGEVVVNSHSAIRKRECSGEILVVIVEP